MDFFKSNWIGLVAMVIAIMGCYLPVSSAVHQSFGGVTNYDEVDATAIKIGGANGNRVGPIMTSTCALIMPSYVGLAATTTLKADCAVTGVVANDIVFAQFASSTNSALADNAGWLVTGASASSTSGFITLTVINNTGAAALIPNSIASTTEYLVFHPLTSVPGL